MGVYGWLCMLQLSWPCGCKACTSVYNSTNSIGPGVQYISSMVCAWPCALCEMVQCVYHSICSTVCSFQVLVVDAAASSALCTLDGALVSWTANMDTSTHTPTKIRYNHVCFEYLRIAQAWRVCSAGGLQCLQWLCINNF